MESQVEWDQEFDVVCGAELEACLERSQLRPRDRESWYWKACLLGGRTALSGGQIWSGALVSVGIESLESNKKPRLPLL